MKDDYKCLECNIIFEYNKPYGEEWPSNPMCPECTSKKTKRQITLGGIHIPPHMKA